MLIRGPQLAALDAVADKELQGIAASHLRHFSPLLAEQAGAQAVAQSIMDAIAQARQHGFEHHGGILLFLELQVLLGSRFYDDPQYSWAWHYLADMTGITALERSRLLHWHTEAYRERVFGTQNEFGRGALERMHLLSIDRIKGAAGAYRARIGELLAWLHPERMPFIDTRAMDVLWQQAQAPALLTDEGSLLVLLIFFIFGHGAFKDPLRPWLSRGAAKLQESPPEARTQVLLVLVRACALKELERLGAAQNVVT